MLPIVAAVMLAARVPGRAGRPCAAVGGGSRRARGRAGRRHVRDPSRTRLTARTGVRRVAYACGQEPRPSGTASGRPSVRGKGPAVTDDTAARHAALRDPARPTQPTTDDFPRPTAGDFEPTSPDRCRRRLGRPPADYGGDPTREAGLRRPANRRSTAVTRRRRPPDPRRQHRRRPLPAAGVPRRPARTCSSGRRSTPPWIGRWR